jgi:KDO2-lipid IV(A) lauroyltransferase
MTLAARLAQQTGAHILILRGQRLPHGRGWCVHASLMEDALPAGGSDEALTEAATVINRAMEQTIRLDPGQYLWAYNRYKQPRPADAAGTAHAAGAAAAEGTPR